MKSKDNILPAKKRRRSPRRESAPDRGLHSEERLFPPVADYSELSVACHRSDFSAARISRAVEDADAHLLNLNVTSLAMPGGRIVVDLRVSHRDAGAVRRSLERYGFDTLQIHSGIDNLESAMADRIGSLMAQIDI